MLLCGGHIEFSLSLLFVFHVLTEYGQPQHLLRAPCHDMMIKGIMYSVKPELYLSG